MSARLFVVSALATRSRAESNLNLASMLADVESQLRLPAWNLDHRPIAQIVP